VTLMKMVFFFAVMLMIAYSALVALNPKARKWATQKDGPTPFKSVNQVLAMPAQLVGKTKEVVAANDARVGTLDHVVADNKKSEAAVAKPLTDPFGKPGAEAPGQSAARTAAASGKEEDDGRISREALLAMAEKDTQAPATPATAPVRPAPTEAPLPAGPAELKLAGGVVVTNQAGENSPAASAPFIYWVAGLTVSGVSNSSPARFLMNGRLVREGDEVNRQLAITFDRVDVAAKLIYFRDKNGAVVTRSY
jgi:hypothetical protein